MTPEAQRTEKEEIPAYAVRAALDKGATDVTAELVDQQQKMIRFSNNEITISKAYQETLLNIFLMIKKHRAFTTLPLSPVGSIEKTVGDLLERAKNTPPAEVYAPLPQGPFQYDPRLLKGPRIRLSADKLTGHVQEAIDSALKEGAKKAAGTLIATKTKRTLATSGQIQATQEKNGLEMSIRAFTSDVASGHSVSISTNEADFRPAEAGRIAGETAKAASNPKQGRPGKCTALLGPLVFADLASQVGSVSSAFQVDIGRSFLVDKVGCEVACDEFTLVDDPTVPDSFGVKAFDDEGAPTRRNVIVDKGVLKTYLHNSTTARKSGVETTGNAGLISPHPWNMIVEPGQRSFEELLAETDRGIYVTNDWYLRYQNYRKGDFSTIPRDGMFLIRKGEISSSVRELRISDNMPRIFQNILELTKSRSWIKWWEVPIPTLTPCALIEDLNFTKSRM
ncbi:MAG: TldD/PmbA family protein [Candidatus Bathyarchaeota archaeon]|nr:TldD/PmbA family protein [Candidatus Bathyarchaeota archaeon]